MKNIEDMKKYILDNNLAHLVRELSQNMDNNENAVKVAIEYVYDQHTMTKEEFIKKYF